MDNAWVQLFNLPAPFNMIILVVALVCVSGIIAGIAKGIQKYACLKHELDFKREMVDRGMSADEIERIVKARSPNQVDEMT